MEDYGRRLRWTILGGGQVWGRPLARLMVSYGDSSLYGIFDLHKYAIGGNIDACDSQKEASRVLGKVSGLGAGIMCVACGGNGRDMGGAC